MELQAEKQAQIQRDKRLQEQAKKIENLSCMILNTQKEDIVYDTEQKMVYVILSLRFICLLIWTILHFYCLTTF